MNATMENTKTTVEKVREIVAVLKPETDFDTVLEIIHSFGIKITDEELFEMQDEIPELANFIDSCGF